MLQLQNIIDNLKKAKEKYSYNNIGIGIAGSYANGTACEGSDIDVVVNGDSTQIDVAEYIKNLFDIQVDVLWMDLLKKEDVELDNFLLSIGMEKNEDSVYKRVLREVIWI